MDVMLMTASFRGCATNAGNTQNAFNDNDEGQRLVPGQGKPEG
jgi:hypothetical protein